MSMQRATLGRTINEFLREGDEVTISAEDDDQVLVGRRVPGQTDIGEYAESWIPRTAIVQNRCWCGGEIGPRVPGDADGLGCLEDINHLANIDRESPDPMIVLGEVVRQVVTEWREKPDTLAEGLARGERVSELLKQRDSSLLADLVSGAHL